MSFASIDFYIFFIITFLGYWLLPHKAQNIFLLITSYFFYSYWDWRFSFLLIISSIIDYYCGLKIEQNQKTNKKKRYLLFSIISNLTILCTFKYLNFFITELNTLLTHFGQDAYKLHLHIILPLGISFYTFQTLSYTIDIYRGYLKPTKNFLDYSLFVSFFPQLIAGPIERASHFLPQIQNKRTFSWDNIKTGFHLIYWGLFKKIFVADNCALITHHTFANLPEKSGSEILVAMYAFSFQMYGDISGYTDIARGVAKCMGFELSLNFQLPYFAKNISDFWRKWHMSMTYWFRDYVFFPTLVKNKGNAYLASFITLLCISLWHSLSLNSILRGIYFGIIVITYRYLKKKINFHNSFINNKIIQTIKNTLSALLTFHIVCIGWLFFQDITVLDFYQIAKKFIFEFQINIFFQKSQILLCYIWVLLIIQMFQHFKKNEFFILKTHNLIKIILYWIMFWYLWGGIGGMNETIPFIYFKF